MKPCPCHSGTNYSACCEPYHLGKHPDTALQLMRSRYSAYALGLADYIMTTTHPHNPTYTQDKIQWKIEILHFCQNISFDGLQILEFTDGEKEAYVTFTARLKQQGQDASFTERSRFAKVDGRWLYVDGRKAKT